MSVCVVIPARYKSSRFPGKPLADLLGKSLLYRVWRQCCKAFPSDQVYVATDDARIVDHCSIHGMQCIVTSEDCLTGTDRVYDATGRMLGAETIISVQGDEPNVNPEDIRKIAEVHKNHKHDVCYGMAPIHDEEKFRDYDCPKVVVGPEGYLLYASRAPIPATKDGGGSPPKSAIQQVCVMALSPRNLALFASSEKTPMEKIEDVEILRFLELGVNVRMVEMTPTVPVDRPGDIKKAIRAAMVRYKTWVFDCDGVLLQSNDIKSNAFYQVALQFGEETAKTFLEYHKNTGGLTRFHKFEYLQSHILGLDKNQEQIDRWIKDYADRCYAALLACETIPGARSLVEALNPRKTYVVSGGEQEQLREVLRTKKFDQFDGIFGSPRSKSDILASLDIEFPAIFVGDAVYDYTVAMERGLDFMFVSDYSDISGEYFENKDCYIIKDFTKI